METPPVAEKDPHEIIKSLGLAYFNDQKERSKVDEQKRRLREGGSASTDGEQTVDHTYDELIAKLENQDYFTPGSNGRSLYDFFQDALNKYETHGSDVAAAVAARGGADRSIEIFDDYKKRAALVRTILENIERTKG